MSLECDLICNQLNIENVNVTQLSKQNFRKIVTQACHRLNEKWLRARANGKRKCSRILTEDYGKKQYISSKKIDNVRNIFRSKTFMQPFAGNYLHYNKYADSDWKCACVQEIENEDHLLSGDCPVYGDLLPEGFDVTNNQDLVKLFSSILERRDKN